ncbi:GNAT family N-acetyltransferase [Agrococcus sp. SGAir0287]|uniref:GNAT family N-acetyltransferase n=1 Tax=Agrococcus sp. SGAir0287 TaxID=2070347 RepID=UPI0010CD0C95|nr:GNAT family N-acetyltransferase [Agrococcus sp. SGAir0287]QCR19847.1 GNAT family N-acetyltransferase [Agrococcus sp. SGAir0287]
MTDATRPAVSVRPVRVDDQERWATLFRAYRDFYRLEPDDAVVERVWSWLMDAAHEVRGLVAEVDGTVVGIAHHRAFARPSTGTTGVWLDDLYADASVRGAGVGRALIAHLGGVAALEGASVVRWITADDNVVAQRLYDRVATRTRWLTYDAVPGASLGAGS